LESREDLMQIKPIWPFFAVERLGLGKRDLKKK
jgi:hypothetical protein